MMPPCARLSTPETPKIKREADRAQAVERTDGEAVDQDLQSEHGVLRVSGARDAGRPPVANHRVANHRAAGGMLSRHPARQLHYRAATYSGSFTNAGNVSLPWHLSAGQMQTCLPFCHWMITPVTKPWPYFMAWVN